MRIRIPKSSMPVMEKKWPKLYPNEQIILHDQGGFKHQSRSGWKVVEFFLTNQRFFLYQLQKVIFEVLLIDIYDLKTEKLYYVLRQREAICILFRKKNKLKEGALRFVVNNSKEWKNKIYQNALLKVNIKIINKIAEQLDTDCKKILLFLWDKHYAMISELAGLINAENHMQVLTTIKDAINPMAEKIIGCPIISFERSKTHPETQEKILFSWWLNGIPKNIKKDRDRLLDIFDEGSYIQVILEIKKVEKKDLKIIVNKNELIIKSEKKGAIWVEKFQLPRNVSLDNNNIHLKNNLLEIRLRTQK